MTYAPTLTELGARALLARIEREGALAGVSLEFGRADFAALADQFNARHLPERLALMAVLRERGAPQKAKCEVCE